MTKTTHDWNDPDWKGALSLDDDDTLVMWCSKCGALCTHGQFSGAKVYEVPGMPDWVADIEPNCVPEFQRLEEKIKAGPPSPSDRLGLLVTPEGKHLGVLWGSMELKSKIDEFTGPPKFEQQYMCEPPENPICEIRKEIRHMSPEERSKIFARIIDGYNLDGSEVPIPKVTFPTPDGFQTVSMLPEPHLRKEHEEWDDRQDERVLAAGVEVMGEPPPITKRDMDRASIQGKILTVDKEDLSDYSRGYLDGQGMSHQSSFYAGTVVRPCPFHAFPQLKGDEEIAAVVELERCVWCRKTKKELGLEE